MLVCRGRICDIFILMKLVRRKNVKGQAVLLVLLSLSVVLIVVMFIVSRSITDISLSSREEDSMRAFSAAEAGIERALIVGSGTSDTLDSASFTSTVTNFATNSTQVVYPMSLKSGEMATFWFYRPSEAGYKGSQMKVCWGDDNTTDTPAIEVTVYYKVGTVYQVARKMIDPDTSGRTQANSTVSKNCTIDGQNFEYYNLVQFNPSDLNIPNYGTAGTLQFATIKMLYNTTTAHKVGVDVTGNASNLPTQGVKIVSAGSYSGANRSVEVYQLNASVPPIFTNAIYSASGVVK